MKNLITSVLMSGFFLFFSISFGLDLFDTELKKTKQELNQIKQELNQIKQELNQTKQELNQTNNDIKLVISNCLNLSEEEIIEEYKIYKDKIIIYTNVSAYTCGLEKKDS